MRSKKTNTLFENAEIIDITTEGKAVAKVDGLVIFVDGGVPGDVGDILVHKKNSRFSEGKLVRIERPSAYRTTPLCQHFGTCGGCKWQDFSYEAQLQFKQKYVSDALVRIGKLEIPEMKPILGCKESYYYRNKLEFSFSDKKWLTKEEIDSGVAFQRDALGFHIPGMFDKVLDIQECHLQAEPSNSIRNGLRHFAKENEIPFFNIREKTGLLRTLMLRTTSIGEVMVLLGFYADEQAIIQKTMTYLRDTFPQITSLQYAISNRAHDNLQGLETIVFSGRDHIFEEMEGLKFKISAKSFYQTNSLQAYELYKVTRELAGLKGNEVVYDLYTGTGTIANFVARQASKVIGVEYVEDAVADARVNSQINNITNTSFFAGDMKDVLNEAFLAEHGRPDVIITDPPRAGMHADVVDVILKASPPKVVYVSCNPSTQARDLALMDAQYKVTHVQPVDMFPQTAHVENVVLLELR